MPIKPENKMLYPENWKQIRKAILKRAQGKRSTPVCEFCKVAQYAVYEWYDGQRGQVCGNGPCDAAGEGKQWPGMVPWTYADARKFAEQLNDSESDEFRYVVIVLTIAHLDHDPTHNDFGNLKALCQRCHNRHDVEHRKQTRKANKNQPELDLCPTRAEMNA